MNAPLTPVSLAELRALPEGKEWLVEQRIADLESLTPVRGQVLAIHHGTALEVRGEAETIVTLCCARCLQQYNHGLRAEVQELIEFRGGSGLQGEDLDDRLDPMGQFDPERWLFEQLSLQLWPRSWGGAHSGAGIS